MVVLFATPLNVFTVSCSINKAKTLCPSCSTDNKTNSLNNNSIFDADSVLGLQHRVVACNVADISEVQLPPPSGSECASW